MKDDGSSIKNEGLCAHSIGHKRLGINGMLTNNNKNINFTINILTTGTY